VTVGNAMKKMHIFGEYLRWKIFQSNSIFVTIKSRYGLVIVESCYHVSTQLFAAGGFHVAKNGFLRM
jgi:hypothetical protein